VNGPVSPRRDILRDWTGTVNACSSKLKELHEDPSSGTPMCRVVEIEHEHGRTTEDMNGPAPGEEPVVKTIILDNNSTAKRAAQCWAREKEVKVGAGVWMWWTDGSRSDDGQVGAAAVGKHGNEWRTRHSYLGTGRMEVFHAEPWVIGLALGETVKRRERLQQHGVKTVAVFSDSQGAIRRAAHLEPGPGQRLARRINRRARNLLAHGITTEIHWVQGRSGIPGKEEEDRQAVTARLHVTCPGPGNPGFI